MSLLTVAFGLLARLNLVLAATAPATPELDQFVEKWLVESKVSGVSIGLIKDGALVVAKGYGLANRETKLAAAVDTVWAMASCSKPVVGIAAMKAVDLGKLELDRDVSDYLGFALRNPNFPAEKITMRLLLAHAASLKDAGKDDITTYPRPDPPQQLEKDIRSWLLPQGEDYAEGAYWDASAKPGAKYAYSNVGSTVAGLVIEKATGQLFNEFCNQHLFAPLGLASTRWFFRELPDAAKVAMPYDENFQPHGYYGFREYPSGQLRSSVTDYARLLLMLMNQGELGGQRILSAATVAEMQRVQFPALDSGGGLQLGVATSDAGVAQYFHQGEESGVGSYFLYQTNKAGGLFMANGSLQSASYDALMNRLLEEIPKLQTGTPPTITAQPQSQTVAAGASVTFTINVSANPPATGQWKFNGVDIPGATSLTLTISNAQSSNAGSYTVVVNNSLGSLTSAPAVLTVTAPPPPVMGVLADNGFRPSVHGFRFENYGSAPGRINLTPDELQRMFGDRVFATATATEKFLTPSAQKWMEATSEQMSGGHCEGMAVLSALIYYKNLDAAKFGAPSINALNIDDNPMLQREIAYWWATQAVDPTRSTEIFGTPTEILDRLIEALKPGAKESYTVGVRMEGKGGHAVTPYAVEDKGGGIVEVLVYDNNHPNTARRLVVDRNKNTWQFSLSTNPSEAESLWTGDVNTRSFSISPSGPRLLTQVAPFLEDTSESVGLQARNQPARRFNELWVKGNGVKILITDPQGKRYGYEAGRFYQEIAGVIHRSLKGGDELWKDSLSPTYYVPVGLAFTLTLDGTVVTKPTETSVTMIGPGYDLEIDNIKLDPNQKDILVFSPDGKSLSYKTSSNESPEISMGFETAAADYSFTVKGVDVEAGSTLQIKLDKAKNTFSISTKGNKVEGTYAFSMGRFENDSAQYFDHDEIDLGPNDTATLDYGKWTGNRTAMPLLIDRNTDGTVDETIQLTDEDQLGAVQPKLSVLAGTGGKIKLSWPATAADFVLEANAALSPTGWTAVPANQVATEGGNKVFTESLVGNARFYRLRKN